MSPTLHSGCKTESDYFRPTFTFFILPIISGLCVMLVILKSGRNHCFLNVTSLDCGVYQINQSLKSDMEVCAVPNLWPLEHDQKIREITYNQTSHSELR